MMCRRKLPDVLTKEETEKLLNAPNKRYPTSYRNYCMMKLALEIGMRVSELINMKIEKIDWNTGKVFIQSGKGDKDRIIYAKNGMLDELKELRDRFNLSNTGNLFTTLKGGVIDSGYLRKMIKRMADKSGITKNVYFHLLRHTFGAETYRDTKDIRVLQEILGHSDVSTTMLYSTISNDDVKRVMTREDY
jgi:integrase/recombinase XerD